MRIYLSHTERDEKFAAELREELAQRGFDVWNPKRDVPRGANWLIESGRALERAEAIVFILSPAATKSSAIQNEIDYALTARRLEDRVFPVVLGSGSAVPWILREIGVITAPANGGRSSAARVASMIKRKIDHPSKSAKEPAEVAVKA